MATLSVAQQMSTLMQKPPNANAANDFLITEGLTALLAGRLPRTARHQLPS